MGTEQSVHRSRSVPQCDENMSIILRNNFHPLHFHQVHGENIKLSRDRTVAFRSEGFCNGIVFSDRPIAVCEPVYVKFLETSPNWSGALRIGFTMHDPSSLISKLPRYACPDLTSMQGNWAKAIGEKFAKKDSILFYYVDHSGDVHYGVGSEEYGIFFGGVNTSGKLWAVLDIYGNSVAVEFMDPNTLNQDCQQNNSLHKVTKRKSKHFPGKLKPLTFHSVHGRNVTLKRDRTIVSKKAGFRTLAYAFTEYPVEINKAIVFFVLETDKYYNGKLVYGITSCNPQTIDPQELPELSYDLLDRSEYWIVKHKSHPFEVGDLIRLVVDSEGQVKVSVNSEPEPEFYVDLSQPLWLFVNLTHSVTELRIAEAEPIKLELNDDDDDSDTSKAVNRSDYDDAVPGPSGQHQNSSDCVICCEEAVDCALYRCGHMCLCFKCAFKLWKSNPSSAHCPICRNSIHDVIKVYK